MGLLDSLRIAFAIGRLRRHLTRTGYDLTGIPDWALREATFRHLTAFRNPEADWSDDYRRAVLDSITAEARRLSADKGA
jgi:hypothetical protein